jgi:citrate synthase
MFSQLACYHEKFLPLGDEELFVEAATQLISKARTIAAYAYRRSQGLPFNYPDPALRYCGNFLHLMFSIPFKQYIIGQEIEDAMNLVLILHADHEQNCSTSTVRLVGSSKVNLFSSICAGICALWGPLHGGANQKVIEMLEEIHSKGMSMEDTIKRASSKSDPFVLMGFGHRVYKTYDPRAKIMREMCNKLLNKLDIKDPLFDIAMELEYQARHNTYFIDRDLYPNVDFYSGIIYRIIGIPTNMFTVMFSMGRMPGWISQWKELHNSEPFKIGRPRQIYTGENRREFIKMEDRK